MSRAFTKEIDEPLPEVLPELPVSAALNLVTARGARLIRAKVVELLRALETAPISDQELRRELRYWSAREASMQVLATPEAPTSVRFGVTVEIVRAGKPLRITIVGEDEADPAQGLIAWTSPLARAIDGAEAGELLEFAAPGGTEMIEVRSIQA
ncbi:MAG TPA: GreA/GreB family elongation factor [Devosia sp.]|jgi:transcription elongation GreA/GreB family factor|nr:GreA/GreB family elongation factor [Devosia sp.]